MPKATGVINSHLHGKLGPITARVVGQETIISQSIEPKEIPVRTEDQMDYRAKFASTAASWKAFRDVLRFTFPKDMPFRSMFSEFMKNNLVECGTFVQKQSLREGTQILNNFIVSDGDLTPIQVIMPQGNDQVFVTNVALDGLTLGASTTVADFAGAVLRNNSDNIASGDMLTILLAAQNIGDGQSTPTDIEAAAFSIEIAESATTAATPLSAVVPLQIISTSAFTQSDGQVRQVLTIVRKPNLMATVIQSREVKGRVTCSKQRLVGTTTILADYLTPLARQKSFESYGGVNHRNRYRPSASRLIALLSGSPNLGGGNLGGTLNPGGGSTGGGGNPGGGGSGGGSGSGSGGGGGMEIENGSTPVPD